MANEYAARGHDVHVIASSQDTDSPGSDEPATVHTVTAPEHTRLRAYYGLYNPYTVGQVGKLLDSIDPDVVHAHNVHEFLSYHTLKISKERGVPVVLTFHDTMSVAYGKMSGFATADHDPGEMVPESDYRLGVTDRIRQAKLGYFPLRTPLNRRYINRYTDARVAVSGTLNRALRANGIEGGEVIHNGVDVDTFAGGDGEALREKLGLSGTRIVLHAGRVGRMKGSVALARAVSEVASNVGSTALVVTGGTEVDWIRRANGVDGELIHETGWLTRETLIDAFHMADVVATPSMYLDPFPTVNIEAMAAGTSVLTSCFSGGREAVVDGVTGVVTNPLDQNRFDADLQMLLAETNRLPAFGARARECAVDRFSLADVVDEYLRRMRVLTG
ncbi:glycosyltransferase family 4 protein [Haloarcula pelagica]|uniref:glycosyltransferase family 4 protein n=1 Tax=Haloarcula pelagica TaxID=3033389 RepID=UPI0024C38F1B|nr:glycosyltransferase family 4 protein [Halomicroarcula sp. YJ-61-S]